LLVVRRVTASWEEAGIADLPALLSPGDTFMGLALPAGGHLTHGMPINMCVA